MTMRHKLVSCFLVVVCATACHSWGSSKDKVKLKDIEVITLHSGSMTTGRRSSPVQQLNHKGSSSFNQYLPSTVQCYNRGHDGYDVQWECVAELPAEVKFGQINVLCEGFDYPDDPYILRGSCGLEYTLENTGAGHRQNSYNSYSKPTYSNWQKGQSGAGSVIPLIIVCVVIYLVYSKCIAPQSRRPAAPTPPQYERESNQNQSAPRRNRLYPDIPPPPYPGTEPSAPESEDPPPAYGWADDVTRGSGHDKTRSQTGYSQAPPNTGDSQSQTRTQTNTNTNDQSGPGFWSGTGIGGILGYMFGRGNSGQGGYYRQQRQRGWGWGNSGGWGNRGGWGGGGGWGGWGSGGGGWGNTHHHHHHHSGGGGGGGGGSWFSGRGGNSGGGGSSWFSSGSTSGGGGGASSGSRRSAGFGGTSRR